MGPQEPTAKDGTDPSLEKLENSYKQKIDFALRRSGIRGQARRTLSRWRAHGLREICQQPANLPWLNEKVWKSLTRSLRVALVFAVSATDNYPDAVSELHKEIRRLLEPFRGRPSKTEISSILSHVVELRKKGFSWLQTAQKYCPERGPAHRCDKRCADRIRVAYQREAKGT
jgi:hypothetical protein